MIADSEVSLVMCPEIPVGGRLSHFLQNWQNITTDKWILSIIKSGYKLEFFQKPYWTGIKKTIVAPENLDTFETEINTLVEKNVIEKVEFPQSLTGFYSTLFLVPKKNGKMRMVTNLKPLNSFLKKIHFKMDTMQKVINLVKPKDWAISLDLSDAYLHVPIFQKHRQYMRFCVQNQCYQWKTMCFGPTCAPRIFTKIVSVVAAYLRAQNIRMAVYLDDWLIVNQEKKQLILDRKRCLDLLVSLGFMINKEKSTLIPSQTVTYLGGVFQLDKGLVFPTLERINKLQMLIQNLYMGNYAIALDFLRILGVMASCIELIPNARLHMRPIQLHLMSFLKSNLQRYDSTNSNYTTSKIPSHVVEKFSEHAERPIYSVSQSQCYSHNRCFQKGFWGLHWDTNFSGGMEFGTERMAHQLFRDESSLPHSQTFSRSTEKQMYFDQERQHKCGSIYQSPRGDKVTQPLLFDMGTMANGNSKQCSIDSRTHYRQEEYFSGPTEQDQNPSIRVVSKQISSQADFLSLGGSSDRSFCILGQQTNRDFLHMDSTSSGTSFGCIDNFMGEHIRVCVSPNLSHSEDFAVYEAIPLSDYINSTAVAQETLVSRHSGVTDSASNQTSKSGGFVESTENPDLSPKSSNVESDCLASLDRNFQTEGFSKSARNLLTASWRKGTQRDYSKKFDKFNSWCTEKQINPYSATLNQVADFLAFLFESGLQYRTISGYRSMLSAVLPPVQNCPVGQHPHISRLIKGVFHSRPPKTKLLPEWDLEIVLKALENKPFEPLNEASLKFVTLKTVFLTAITTFRRCSDLQSLRIDHESMKIQEKGITFIRHGLSKQDRQSHFGIKIHVPHFPERELLDPKRAINIYLDKTKNSRQKLEPSDKVKLFLAINEPHKPVATVTISNWIVQAIKTAYSDESLKVTAHSTRAIAPSWALYKGASTKSILDAADWSSESTFVKFYLRDLDSDKLLQ